MFPSSLLSGWLDVLLPHPCRPKWEEADPVCQVSPKGLASPHSVTTGLHLVFVFVFNLLSSAAQPCPRGTGSASISVTTQDHLSRCAIQRGTGALNKAVNTARVASPAPGD